MQLPHPGLHLPPQLRLVRPPLRPDASQGLAGAVKNAAIPWGDAGADGLLHRQAPANAFCQSKQRCGCGLLPAKRRLCLLRGAQRAGNSPQGQRVEHLARKRCIHGPSDVVDALEPAWDRREQKTARENEGRLNVMREHQLGGRGRLCCHSLKLHRLRLCCFLQKCLTLLLRPAHRQSLGSHGQLGAQGCLREPGHLPAQAWPFQQAKRL